MNKSEKKQELIRLIDRIEAYKKHEKMQQEFHARYNIKPGGLMEFQTTRTESLKELMDKVFMLAAKHVKECPNLFSTDNHEEKINSLYQAVSDILDSENSEFANVLKDYIVNHINEVTKILEQADV